MLAFCSLNTAMYFWWNKPLDVRCRIPLYLKPDSDYPHKAAANNDETERTSMLTIEEPPQGQLYASMEDDELVRRSFKIVNTMN